MAEPTRAQLQSEVDRLREENENLRFVCQRLLDANRLMMEASDAADDAMTMRLRAAKLLRQADEHKNDALRIFTTPTIPNN